MLVVPSPVSTVTRHAWSTFRALALSFSHINKFDCVSFVIVYLLSQHCLSSGLNSNIPLFCLSDWNATQCSYENIGRLDGQYHPTLTVKPF